MGLNKSSKILVIVESPNKCKTLQKILVDGGYTSAMVVACVGHISEIKDGGSYYNTGIEPANKFKTNYAISKDKEEVVNKLKSLVEKSDIVLIASDPDREGEAIAWSLRKFLKLDKSKYKRITFHEITKKAVLSAIENPSDIDDDLVSAAQSRQKLDKLLGYRLSPIARRCVSAKSVGRCQSAGLKLICDRENEIRNFKPETYFDLFLNFTKNSNEYKAKYVGTTKELTKRITCKDIVENVIKECEGKDYKIRDIVTKEKLSNPKPPFTTSTFQQEVSTKLGISVKKSMEYAQHLFEGLEINGEHIALITYIRTDSNEFAPEFLPILEDYVKSTFGEKYFSPIRKAKKGENAQEGHEAIRPVNLDMTPEILSRYISDPNLIKVYRIIYNRTIATMMASSITSETTYEIVNGNHLFNLVSKELLFDGFKRVYNYKDDEDEDVSTDIFEKGEKLLNTKLNCVEKQTQPPARYKEATFIKELESTGIGRPSTFATIVNTILDKGRGYCEIVDKCIVPTEKGMTLSKFLDESFPNLINVNYTSELEKDLDLIARGKLNQVDFLTTFYTTMEDTIKGMPRPTKTSTDVVIGEDKCPICGAIMYLRKSQYGEFFGCSRYPQCKGIIKKS